MSLIRRISDFFKKQERHTIEDLLQDNEVKDLLSTYKKQTTLLQPHRSDKEIDFRKSKMGGMPNLNGFQEWPICDECNKPLDFVLQLYKTDFPDFYFPENKNIFQLFKCPDLYCPGKSYLYEMFHYYQNVNTDKNNEVEIPELDNKEVRDLGEEKAQECYFEPEISDDYPEYFEYPEDERANFENKHSQEIVWLFWENFSVKRDTKFGGYPSWTQSPDYPFCECGSQIELFFQLTGDEDHGLFLGDGGSIYYFVCKKCGEKSIESRCDFT